MVSSARWIRTRIDLSGGDVLLGEMDHLPEGAFYMVGGIEDVSARAEKLASER